MTRNEKILSMRGLKSFTLIAKELGISRSVVAGVCWRHDWPYKYRVPSPNSISGNSCGLGRHGPGEHAKITVYDVR